MLEIAVSKCCASACPRLGQPVCLACFGGRGRRGEVAKVLLETAISVSQLISKTGAAGMPGTLGGGGGRGGWIAKVLLREKEYRISESWSCNQLRGEQ